MNGILTELHYSTVIDNVDPLKAGRIKIKIPYFHKEVEDDLLPWAVQNCVGGGGSSTYGKSFIPEIGSQIWCGFLDDRDLKKPFYVADIQLRDFHPHTLFEDNVKSDLVSSSSYPNTKFTYYKNGVCIGVDSSDANPEIFVYHPTGSYFKILKDGKTYLKSDSGTFEKMIKGETLKSILESLIDAISLITVTCAAPGNPSSVPINVASFTLIKSQLITILSNNNLID